MSCCIACLADSERQLKHGIWKLFSLMNQTLHTSYLSLYANTMPVTQWENLLWVIHYGRLICFLFYSFYLGQIINVLNVKAEEEQCHVHSFGETGNPTMEGRIQDELRCCLQWWPTSRRTNLQKQKLALLFVVQSLSRVWLFETPRTAACQTSLSFTISWSLSKLTSNDSVMPYNHLILCHPLFLLPSIFPSIRALGILY